MEVEVTGTTMADIEVGLPTVHEEPEEEEDEPEDDEEVDPEDDPEDLE